MGFSDYHIHTVYSRHGKGSVDDVVQGALAREVSIIGFSEHFPLPVDFIDPTPNRGSGMIWEEIDHYIQEVEEAREKYRDRLTILLGYELDYLPEHFDQVQASLARYPHDYLVGSIHFLGSYPAPDGGKVNFILDHDAEAWKTGTAFWGGTQEVCRAYYERVREHVRTTQFEIVGHLDLIKKFNKDGELFDRNSSTYLGYVEETLDVIKAHDRIIEVNTAGLYKLVGEIYPSDPILQMILQRRIPICISSDAHNPEHVARDFGATWSRLQKMGFSRLTDVKR